MKNSKFNQHKFPILIGLFMGIILLYLFSPSKNSKKVLEEFALGQNTKTLKGSVEGKIVHCSDLKDLSGCINGYKSNIKKNPVIIWLGNSQLHAI